jgi:hypothetical protein
MDTAASFPLSCPPGAALLELRHPESEGGCTCRDENPHLLVVMQRLPLCPAKLEKGSFDFLDGWRFPQEIRETEDELVW